MSEPSRGLMQIDAIRFIFRALSFILSFFVCFLILFSFVLFSFFFFCFCFFFEAR